ncbi:hypothetical protein IE077_000813 [Cardiosporidium cionae]|uniref:RxLR effector candidate protein n=1 Tax=Cardiosporidium cionae TaxID=476202 RepID=A0ABQ7JDW3_9APIC|nr:hypothetical protein IE077_000813 [Cardiosporidium cionae]|eukprot:KAF8822200.1 hypothetical protein IE077_000813 [Cardiosporidium cionae]
MQILVGSLLLFFVAHFMLKCESFLFNRISHRPYNDISTFAMIAKSRIAHLPKIPQGDAVLPSDLTAPYLTELHPILEEMCFSNKTKPPDIFDRVASALRIPSDNLRKDVAVLQRKYISELVDDLKTRSLLGKLILHTGQRQLLKFMYKGITQEIMEKMKHLLFSTHNLSQLRSIIASEYSNDEWNSFSPIVKKEIIQAQVAVNPHSVRRVILQAMNTTGLGTSEEFLANFLKKGQFVTRGGKHYTRKTLGRFREEAAAMKQRLEAAHKPSETDKEIPHVDFWERSHLWNILLAWIKEECGPIRNKIKHDVYECIFGASNILNSTLCSAFVPAKVTSIQWEMERQPLIEKNLTSKVEMKEITRNRRQALDEYVAGNEVEVWNVLDVLLENGGFSPRGTLTAAIKRVQADKRYNLQLKDFCFSMYGAPHVSKNGTNLAKMQNAT